MKICLNCDKIGWNEIEIKFINECSHDNDFGISSKTSTRFDFDFILLKRNWTYFSVGPINIKKIRNFLIFFILMEPTEKFVQFRFSKMKSKSNCVEVLFDIPKSLSCLYSLNFFYLNFMSPNFVHYRSRQILQILNCENNYPCPLLQSPSFSHNRRWKGATTFSLTTLRHYVIQHNYIQHIGNQLNDTQLNDTLLNNIEQIDTRHNNTQHNDIQHINI